MIRPRCSFGAERKVRVIAAGITNPPPRPWSTRNAIRLGASQEIAASPDPIVNTVRAVRNTRRPPYRPIAQAAVGIPAATASV